MDRLVHQERQNVLAFLLFLIIEVSHVVQIILVGRQGPAHKRTLGPILQVRINFDRNRDEY